MPLNDTFINGYSVASGVGDDFIAYLKRKQIQYKPEKRYDIVLSPKSTEQCHKSLVTEQYHKSLVIEDVTCIDCNCNLQRYHKKRIRCNSCQRKFVYAQKDRKKSPETRTLSCAYCETLFTYVVSGGHGANRRFCSRECKNKDYNKQRQEARRQR